MVLLIFFTGEITKLNLAVVLFRYDKTAIKEIVFSISYKFLAVVSTRSSHKTRAFPKW